MWRRLRQLWRVTALRLSIAYTLAFGAMAVFLVFYMTGGAVDYLRRQFEVSINEEVASLQKIFADRGLNALIRTMERRSNAPGANLYLISAPDGRILAGNVRSLERGVLARTGWVMRPFEYDSFNENPGKIVRQAVARVFVLPNGMRILIGQDIGQPERLRGIVRNALSISMLAMLIVGFLIWFFVGRRALKRIDLVSKSTERILAGDRAERLPVTGSNDEFDRLSIRMNAMLDRITLLDSGLRNVSDSIAHDLKTPLTRLRNKADAARGMEKGGKEALSEIINDADQIIKTFNALLMISRVESGSQVTELEPLDYSAVVSDVAELYEPVAEEQGVKLITDIAPDITINGSRELLSQALANLLDNGLKYGHPTDGGKPKISVTLNSQGSEMKTTVADNGDGIAPGDRERVLERFARLDESRSKPGTGLGLSLVNAVATLHGGHFELGDAEPGLEARLVLPLAGKRKRQPRGKGKRGDGKAA